VIGALRVAPGKIAYVTRQTARDKKAITLAIGLGSCRWHRRAIAPRKCGGHRRPRALVGCRLRLQRQADVGKDQEMSRNRSIRAVQ